MKLLACLDGQLAGTIEGANYRASFIYSDSWIAAPDAYPLSSSLPLQSAPHTGKTVLNFLWGLLPDNERTLDAWARRFHVSARNPLALLAHVGEDCAGAIQLVTEDGLPDILQSSRRDSEVDWLSTQQFEQRIARLAQDAAAGRTSAQEGQFSLAGAQAKTALHFDTRRQRWGIPRGRTPTTHILKPVSNEFDGFAENEHFCLALARRVGLAAAFTQWQSIAGVPTLVVERYDRIQRQGRWHRIHQEDFCQALGMHPGAKYENDGGPGFAQIMALLDGADEPEADRERLMKTACLIYLLGATDMHAKNFSLLRGPGIGRPSLRLAPCYDIASAWPYPQQLPAQKVKLAMRVGKHYRIREILPRHFEELARACRYPPDRIVLLLKELAEQLPDAAASLHKELTVKGMLRSTLTALVDGVVRQCQIVLRHFQPY